MPCRLERLERNFCLKKPKLLDFRPSLFEFTSARADNCIFYDMDYLTSLHSIIMAPAFYAFIHTSLAFLICDLRLCVPEVHSSFFCELLMQPCCTCDLLVASFGLKSTVLRLITGFSLGRSRLLWQTAMGSRIGCQLLKARRSHRTQETRDVLFHSMSASAVLLLVHFLNPTSSASCLLPFLDNPWRLRRTTT